MRRRRDGKEKDNVILTDAVRLRQLQAGLETDPVRTVHFAVEATSRSTFLTAAVFKVLS